VNPLGYFIGPRLVAALMVFPMHTAFFDIIGIFGGYVTAVGLVGQEPGIYWQSVQSGLTPKEVYGGLFKSIAFGFTVIAICAFRRLQHPPTLARTRARGVSESTTRAWFYSSIAVLALDYLITSFNNSE